MPEENLKVLFIDKGRQDSGLKRSNLEKIRLYNTEIIE